MAQPAGVSFVSPLDIPLILSANFGELRPGHFHSGVDFKTQGRTGLPIYAVDEGYISRVSVSPGGYGKALYVTHPSGYTSVYAHLDSFAPFIADSIRSIQYAKESFSINEYFPADAFPVTRGMRIATSGNSGSSGGPHLHFEIRHTESESPIDPLPWYQSKVKDDMAPEPRLVAVYPHNGVVNDKRRKGVSSLTAVGGNRYKATQEFTAWGEVSFGIKAYDRMTGTSNIYGVRNVRCWVDETLVFETTIDSITFDETVYINSLIDFYELRSNGGSTIMRSYVMPGNRLSTIYSDDMSPDGTYIIDEERTYRCRYELTDLYNNTSIVNFEIKGKESKIVAKQHTGVVFDYAHDNQYATDEMLFELPAHNLYEDIDFEYSYTESDTYYAGVHSIHHRTTPIHGSGKLALKLTCDTLPDSCYYVVRLHNGHKSAVGGRYDAGWCIAQIGSLGTYSVAADLTPPSITPLNPEKWSSTGKVSFKISDRDTGIADYRGEIDGHYCMFDFDAKTARLVCDLKYTPIKRGTQHVVKLWAIDGCGHRRVVEHKFTW